MHDPEKSDSGIVATKPTNKAGRPVAEPVEPDIYERLRIVRFGAPPEPYLVDEARDRADATLVYDDDMPPIPEVSNTIPRDTPSSAVPMAIS